ncbi:MAG: N-acyl-D-aspartate/D-glutamate deacylase [Parcubacteria group bacterium Athens0714_24]|nr:MAG: N-acyl-D-aspartate/D-glutamate deacylase [Parcubacteria group bacterium Athens0714_24]
MAKYDVLIKNGTVLDGLGGKIENADVGISGDEIKDIGNLGTDADEIIDATGKYIAPGFIDLTNHSDTHWTLFKYPPQESLLYQGITTILGGNCGSSLAPVFREDSLREIGRWTDISQININWQTMKEFLEQLSKQKIGVNFATLVGFNTVEQSVLGREMKIPEEKEIQQIKLLLENALEEGAFGVSTNFGLANVRLFKDEDLTEIFSVLKKHKAILKHHLEDEGENILPAISRAITISKKTKTKMHITHFKTLGKNSWKFMTGAIEMIKRAQALDNEKITCDFFPYTKTGSSLFMFLPSWFRKLPVSEAQNIIKLKDDSRRQNLKDYIKELTLHYDKIIIASASKELNVAGKTIEKISQETGLDNEEIILNLLETNNFRVSVFNEAISPENVELIAQEDFSAVASDGVGYQTSNFKYQKSDLPHPRSFGAFPRAIQWLVKEKGILTWEKIIYKMTGLAAQILGLKDRGVLKSGNRADVVVINPEKINDSASYENPFKYAEGIDAVLVNGKISIKDGNFTGQLNGRVLKK